MHASGRNILLCGLLGACTVGNTGNPSKGSDSHPEGIELLRSELKRDASPDVPSEELRSFASDQQAFAGDIYRELAQDDANLLFSPYSIASALAMTYAGAAGTTKQEMAAALHFKLPEPKLHAAFNSVDLALEGRAQELAEGTTGDGFQLHTSNATFVQRGLAVQREFLDVLATNYDAGLFVADFVAAAERERKAINRWVFDQTEKRIEEVLPAASIGPTTRIVLVNTIYFKGSWLTKFDPKETKSETFHAVEADVAVPMMHKAFKASYTRGADFQAVELPYVSDSVRMLLVLPDDGQQAAVEAQLQNGFFNEVSRGGLEARTVDLRLPRFSFRSTFALRPVLRSLGMERAFSDDADFSSIAGVPGDLFIDNVYHQAFVAVDEEGTEAAGATAVVINVRSAEPEPVSLTFDRPFLFFIYDATTEQILFAGRLSKP